LAKEEAARQAEEQAMIREDEATSLIEKHEREILHAWDDAGGCKHRPTLTELQTEKYNVIIPILEVGQEKFDGSFNYYHKGIVMSVSDKDSSNKKSSVFVALDMEDPDEVLPDIEYDYDNTNLRWLKMTAKEKSSLLFGRYRAIELPSVLIHEDELSMASKPPIKQAKGHRTRFVVGQTEEEELISDGEIIDVNENSNTVNLFLQANNDKGLSLFTDISYDSSELEIYTRASFKETIPVSCPNIREAIHYRVEIEAETEERDGQKSEAQEKVYESGQVISTNHEKGTLYLYMDTLDGEGEKEERLYDAADNAVKWYPMHKIYKGYTGCKCHGPKGYYVDECRREKS